MPLSWNEIKGRASAFSKEWENDVSEDAQAKSFWDDFFNVFGIGLPRVATSVNDYFLVAVDRSYGIEYEEFPSQIAQVAMWLMDHQMNE